MTTRHAGLAWRAMAVSLLLLPSLLAAEDAPAERAKATPVDIGGAIVFVDPTSGRLQATAPEDAERIAAALRQRFGIGRESTATVGRDGTRSVVVGPEWIHFATLGIDPDGTRRTRCVQGADAAAHALTESRTTADPAPAQE